MILPTNPDHFVTIPESKSRVKIYEESQSFEMKWICILFLSKEYPNH